MAFRNRSRSPHGAGNEEIKDLIVQREQARLNQDWAQADQLRERLVALGVTLSDKTNSWRSSDGQTGRIPTWTDLQAGRINMEMSVVSMEPSDYKGGESEVQIRSLIHDREQARAKKDFAESDRLREELKGLGVDINDKEKFWKQASSGLQGCILGFSSDRVTDLEINTLIVQREKARKDNDFDKADVIRDDLKRAGVEIQDKGKMWRTADGRTGAVPQWGQIEGVVSVQQPAFVQSFPAMSNGNGNSQLNDSVIRAAQMCCQNPATAQRALLALQQVLGVSIPPPAPGRPAVPAQGKKAKAPAVPKNGGTVAEALGFIEHCKAVSHVPNDTEAEWLISTREKMRAAKDFQGADMMRSALRMVGIDINEKGKSWTSSDGRSGIIPQWSDLGI